MKGATSVSALVRALYPEAGRASSERGSAFQGEEMHSHEAGAIRVFGCVPLLGSHGAVLKTSSLPTGCHMWANLSLQPISHGILGYIEVIVHL